MNKQREAMRILNAPIDTIVKMPKPKQRRKMSAQEQKYHLVPQWRRRRPTRNK